MHFHQFQIWLPSGISPFLAYVGVPLSLVNLQQTTRTLFQLSVCWTIWMHRTSSFNLHRRFSRPPVQQNKEITDDCSHFFISLRLLWVNHSFWAQKFLCGVRFLLLRHSWILGSSHSKFYRLGTSLNLPWWVVFKTFSLIGRFPLPLKEIWDGFYGPYSLDFFLVILLTVLTYKNLIYLFYYLLNLQFYDPSLTPTGGSGGKFDLLARLSTYGFLLPPNIFYGSKCKYLRR